MEFDHHRPQEAEPCGCFSAPYHFLEYENELGMDDEFAEVSLLVCSVCGQKWLRYFYENEAFTASGRWYLGAIAGEQTSVLNVANAKATLEGLSWYYYGGSYFGGQFARTSGTIVLNP